MPLFRYKATDKNNRPAEGTIEAENRYMAVARLLQDGLHVDKLDEFEDVEAVSEEAKAQFEAGLPTENVPLGEDQRIAVIDGLSQVVRSGLPLSTGLRALSSELPSRRARRAITTIANRLEQGISVDNAVAGQLEIVPRHLKVLLRAGLHTGRLAELLEHYLHFARASLDTHRRNVVALFYPALLILLAVMVAGAMLSFVVPPFEDIFNDFGMEIPEFTQVTLWMAKAVSGWRLAILPVLLFVLACTWMVVGKVAGSLQQKCLYYVPAVGRMIRLSAISRFCHLLAIGIDHHVPLPEALRLAGSGTGDAYIGQATHRMAIDIEGGLSLGHAATAHRMVPEVAHVFEWEGRDDAFADILRATGDICAAQAREQSGLIRILIEPLTMIGVAAIVTIVVISLLMPMIRLLEALA